MHFKLMYLHHSLGLIFDTDFVKISFMTALREKPPRRLDVSKPIHINFCLLNSKLLQTCLFTKIGVIFMLYFF